MKIHPGCLLMELAAEQGRVTLFTSEEVEALLCYADLCEKSGELDDFANWVESCVKRMQSAELIEQIIEVFQSYENYLMSEEAALERAKRLRSDQGGNE